MSEKLNFKKIIYLDTVDSTNLYAQELLKSKKLDGPSLIMSYEQSKGRGQRSASWSSNPYENLLFSMVLMPKNLGLEKIFYLSKITALAVADFMDKMTVDHAEIKWPNDIYVNGKKIAGILIENNLSANRLKSTVIGVGININQCEFEKAMNATSLQLQSGEQYDLKLMLHEFLNSFSKYYQRLEQLDFKQIDAEYFHRLYLFNKVSNYHDSEGVFKGQIIGVAEDGKLQMKKQTGEKLSYDIKEVKFIT